MTRAIQKLFIKNYFSQLKFTNLKYRSWVSGGSRAAATSKMERFLIIANDWKPLIVITKHSRSASHELYFHFKAKTFIITESRGGSRAVATSKMERFVIIVTGFQPLTIITKCFILDVVAALDPPLESLKNFPSQLKTLWNLARSFVISYTSLYLWNLIPDNIRSETSSELFNKKIWK